MEDNLITILILTLMIFSYINIPLLLFILAFIVYLIESPKERALRVKKRIKKAAEAHGVFERDKSFEHNLANSVSKMLEDLAVVNYGCFQFSELSAPLQSELIYRGMACSLIIAKRARLDAESVSDKVLSNIYGENYIESAPAVGTLGLKLSRREHEKALEPFRDASLKMRGGYKMSIGVISVPYVNLMAKRNSSKHLKLFLKNI